MRLLTLSTRLRQRGFTVAAAPFFVVLTSGLFAPVAVTANSTNNNVVAISCGTALHVADFHNCALDYAGMTGFNGLYVATSANNAATAFARSAGWHLLYCRGTLSECVYTGGTITLLNLDGTALTTDTQLVALDKTLVANMRAAGPTSKPVPVPPAYGVSYIGNDTLNEDTSSAINQAMGERGLNPVTIAAGTIVTVIWQDGTSAQFIKVPGTATELQWVYVPGSAKDKNGNPLDPPNTNTTGTGSGAVEAVVTPSPGYNWNLRIGGGNQCTTSITITDTTGAVVYQSSWVSPC